jgi:integrase
VASLRKRGRVWYFRFTDSDGVKRERKGCTDKRATEELARAAESEAAKVRAGLIDPRDRATLAQQARPLAVHLADFESDMLAKGDTPKHAKLYADRARRVAGLVMGGRLADIDPGRRAPRAAREHAAAVMAGLLGAGRLGDLTAYRVQEALATLRKAGRSLLTLNHHRASIRGFVLWARKDGRLRDDPLFGLAGFNANEDRRHDRRTISVGELQRLIEAAHARPPYRLMTGPARALCYRLAVATGLRYSETLSLTPASFDGASITVLAAYAKNGRTATLPLPPDVAADLDRFLAGVPEGRPIFPSRPGRGRRCCGATWKPPASPTATTPGVSSTSTRCGASAPPWPTPPECHLGSSSAS